MKCVSTVLPVFLHLYAVEETFQEIVDGLGRAIGRKQWCGVPNPFALCVDAGVVVIQASKFPSHFVQPPFGHFIDVLHGVNAGLYRVAHDLQSLFDGLCHGKAVLVGKQEIREKLHDGKVDHVVITASVIFPLQRVSAATAV